MSLLLTVFYTLVSVFDGMALVWMFKCTDHTYNKFVDDLLKFAVEKMTGSKCIDIVFDVYYENSI